MHKPAGPTSRAVLNDISRLFDERRCGHAGTLDPAATGVLVVAFGEATKTVRWLVEGGKSYRAEVRFGQATDTDDAQGEVIAQMPCPELTEGRLLTMGRRVLGEFDQLPPSVSALRRDGVRDHERVRRGEVVQRTPRRVRLDDVRLLSLAAPLVTFELDTGPGFYVRAWARDLGLALGSAAHLSGLVRLRASGIHLNETHTMAELAELDLAGRRGLLREVGEVLCRRLPDLTVSDEVAAQLKQGKRPELPWPGPPLPLAAIVIRAGSDGRLICVASAELLAEGAEGEAGPRAGPARCRLTVSRGFDPEVEVR